MENFANIFYIVLVMSYLLLLSVLVLAPILKHQPGGEMAESRSPEEIRNALFRRARGRCECETKNCTHPRTEVWSNRCTRSLGNDWEAHRKTAGGGDVRPNLEALCKSCYWQTRTYKGESVGNWRVQSWE